MQKRKNKLERLKTWGKTNQVLLGDDTGGIDQLAYWTPISAQIAHFCKLADRTKK